MGMKMARASEQDLECAQQIASFLEDLQRGYIPQALSSDPEETEWFDESDAHECQRVLRNLLEIAEEGNLFRVTFGMLVLLDPANKLLDPESDILEAHPEIVAALAAAAPKEA